MPQCLTKVESGQAVTGFMVAARLILHYWESPDKPEITEWFKKRTEITAFENMIAKLKNN